jgi:hypothetical protein
VDRRRYFQPHVRSKVREAPADAIIRVGAQHGDIGIVVDRGEFGAPHQEARPWRVQYHFDSRHQSDGPRFDRAERSVGPVCGAYRPSHHAFFVSERPLDAPDKELGHSLRLELASGSTMSLCHGDACVQGR